MPDPGPALGERFAALASPAGAPATGEVGGDDAAEVVMRLGRALHTAGNAAHRIEEGMEAAARRLGLTGQFFSTPTALFASFADGGGGPRRTILERVQPGEVNLERLADLDRVLGDLASGELTPAAAAARLDSVERAAGPQRWGAVLTTVSFALISGSAAQFLGGGGREVAAAAALGLLVGGLASLAGRTAAVGRLFEPLAALLASFASTLTAVAWPPLSVLLVMLAGIIVLVPGLTLTVAISELASRQLVSGSARLMGAVALFFGIALGVAVGGRLGAALVGVPAAVEPEPLGPLWRWPALLAAAAALTVLLRARPRDAGWILFGGVLAIEGVRLGALLLGPQLGAFLGAFAVGVGGNLYARVGHRPAQVVQVPGLILLVPGSLGFRSLAALLEQDVLSGVQTAFTTTLVAIALATGILLANVVLPPRRIL
jgi:uncharacterized membrane protein YjjP (DUF1212 family)